MNSKTIQKKQVRPTAGQGFTLVELVVVVTIISILGAFALPKFAALQADARMAKMQSAVGSMKAAAAMAHATLVTRGHSGSFTGTPDPAIVIEGVSVTYVNGYPNAASIVALAGLAEDYVITGLTAPRVVAADSKHTGSSSANDCTVSYIAPAAANTQPSYTVNATIDNCT
ncbi:prepilin-type N-terminal cleavage/methylation domain-containing protein [Noviherbaspirillum sp. CPCC 100848]|uniref:Prepilin-type N-terminal cleavage/methylation domain-containing protein n=1 Tax=Noviherbaspirillum album TaxID=3080276 RepID=A0ABU6JH44_9BURK|nr:prepilin-type N-terminal cleavage/methylation domain-containing protein [Noviherbaspirillum sp. CPCC 100848]MEC4722990.1 prepilin-type N-terminal cleavage/methylation domain-containing protein [Noviherbaspirillum sp. CPCC 100848]